MGDSNGNEEFDYYEFWRSQDDEAAGLPPPRKERQVDRDGNPYRFNVALSDDNPSPVAVKIRVANKVSRSAAGRRARYGSLFPYTTRRRTIKRTVERALRSLSGEGISTWDVQSERLIFERDRIADIVRRNLREKPRRRAAFDQAYAKTPWRILEPAWTMQWFYAPDKRASEKYQVRGGHWVKRQGPEWD